jgi:hypothetical protein
MGRTSRDEAEPLYQALWALVTPGATLAAIVEQEALLDLARVRAQDPESAKERRAALAREELIAACRALDNPMLAIEPRWHGEGAAVLALLGLATGFHSAPLHRRRDAAASLLSYAVGTAFKTRPGVRSHVQNAVYAVADKLWERDVQGRATTSASLLEEQRAAVSALTVDLLRRYEAYYAMYTPLSGLRADLTTVLELRRDGEDEMNKIDAFVASSLHAYAEFLLAKRDFMDSYHGVWVFAQADIEQAVADAIKFIEHFSGVRYRDESLLRLEQAEHQELHSFISQLEADEVGRQALRRWHQRIFECGCEPEQPSPECRVHMLMRACEYYTLVLDLDWYRVVPWHQGPPPSLGAVDPASLYRDIGLR